MAVVIVDDTPSNQAEALLALRAAQNADPDHRVFYHWRFLGGSQGFAIVRIDHPTDLAGGTP